MYVCIHIFYIFCFHLSSRGMRNQNKLELFCSIIWLALSSTHAVKNCKRFAPSKINQPQMYS